MEQNKRNGQKFDLIMDDPVDFIAGGLAGGDLSFLEEEIVEKKRVDPVKINPIDRN